MKAAIISGIAALFLATGTAHSWDSHQTTFGKGYFSGLAAGFVVAAIALEKEQLFCPLENLNITGEMLEDMIGEYGKKHPELKSRSLSIPTVALLVLQRTFPCKPQ